jgi:hypothetical protein
MSGVVARQRYLFLLHTVDRGRCDVTTSREAEPLPFLSQRLKSALPLPSWYSRVRHRCIANTPDTQVDDCRVTMVDRRTIVTTRTRHTILSLKLLLLVAWSGLIIVILLASC